MYVCIIRLIREYSFLIEGKVLVDKLKGIFSNQPNILYGGKYVWMHFFYVTQNISESEKKNLRVKKINKYLFISPQNISNNLSKTFSQNISSSACYYQLWQGRAGPGREDTN